MRTARQPLKCIWYHNIGEDGQEVERWKAKSGGKVLECRRQGSEDTASDADEEMMNALLGLSEFVCDCNLKNISRQQSGIVHQRRQTLLMRRQIFSHHTVKASVAVALASQIGTRASSIDTDASKEKRQSKTCRKLYYTLGLADKQAVLLCVNTPLSIRDALSYRKWSIAQVDEWSQRARWCFHATGRLNSGNMHKVQ